MITWPQACRAQASLAAFSLALHKLRTRPAHEVAAWLEERIKEKEEMLKTYAGEQGQSPNAATKIND